MPTWWDLVLWDGLLDADLAALQLAVVLLTDRVLHASTAARCRRTTAGAAHKFVGRCTECKERQQQHEQNTPVEVNEAEATRAVGHLVHHDFSLGGAVVLELCVW